MKAEIEALEKLLASQLDLHQQLLDCIARKTEAIRTARIDALTEILNQQRSLAKSISEIERHRIALTHKITRTIQPNATQALAMSDILKYVDDPALHDRLQHLTHQLRALVAQVHQRASIVRAAAHALSQHMAGVMQTVHSALSRAGVYSSHGRVALGTQLDFSIDIKS